LPSVRPPASTSATKSSSARARPGSS
jgi:hypothetical protein